LRTSLVLAETNFLLSLRDGLAESALFSNLSLLWIMKPAIAPPIKIIANRTRSRIAPTGRPASVTVSEVGAKPI